MGEEMNGVFVENKSGVHPFHGRLEKAKGDGVDIVSYDENCPICRLQRGLLTGIDSNGDYVPPDDEDDLDPATGLFIAIALSVLMWVFILVVFGG